MEVELNPCSPLPTKPNCQVLSWWLDKLSLYTVTFISGVLYFISGEGNGNPLQYSCLENPMDWGAWWAAVHGVARVRHDWVTSLSLFTFMHWRSKWQPTPVFLPGVSQGRGSLVGCHLGLHRVGHDWSNLAAAAGPPILLLNFHLFSPSICMLVFSSFLLLGRIP